MLLSDTSYENYTIVIVWLPDSSYGNHMIVVWLADTLYYNYTIIVWLADTLYDSYKIVVWLSGGGELQASAVAGGQYSLPQGLRAPFFLRYIGQCISSSSSSSSSSSIP